jgi:hypothetical protein
VTENGTVPAGENGSHPAPVFGEDWVPDGVDAGMDSMETSRIKSMFDCAATEAEIE